MCKIIFIKVFLFSSNGKVEATTSESLARCSSLVDDSWFESLLSLSLHLLSSLLLVVLSLHVLELSSESFDLILVLVDLSLIHVELGSHSLHLRGLLLEVLLVDGELLSDLWTRLSREKVLQLDVELLLLLDDDVLLNDLFGLLDQSLLESHDLLEHFVSIRIGTFKLSPSVAVEWVLELLGKCLDLESLSEQLLLQVVDFLSQVWDLGGLRFDDSEFGLVVTDLELEESDIFESLLVLDFTSGESGLKNLDLLVKKGELIVSSDELGTKNISLVDDILEVLLELFDLFVGLLDDVGQLGDLIVELVSQFFGFFVLGLRVLEFSVDLLDCLSIDSLFVVLLSQGLVFGLNLILELGDLVRSDLELSLELSDLILCFDKVLRVEVSIGSDSLIQVLLLLELTFELNILLLEFTDKVLLQLDLFDHLHKVCVGLRSFVRESISILLKFVDLSEKLGDVLLLHSALFFELTDLIVLLGDLILVLDVVILGLFDGLGHHVSESDEVDDLLLVGLSVSSEMLDLSGQGIDTVLGEILLVVSRFLLSGDTIVVVSQTVVVSIEILVALLEVPDLSSHLTNFDLEVVLLLLIGLDVSLHAFVGVTKLLTLLGFHVELLFLVLELVVVSFTLVLEYLDFLLFGRFFFLKFLDRGFSVGKVLEQLLLFGIHSLGISLVLNLLFLKLVNLVLLLLELFLFGQKFRVELDNSGVQSALLLVKVIVLLFEAFNFLLKLFLLSDELVNGVVLTKRESRALLYDLVKLGNLIL